MGYARTRSNKECSGDSQTCDWLPRLCLCSCLGWPLMMKHVPQWPYEGDARRRLHLKAKCNKEMRPKVWCSPFGLKQLLCMSCQLHHFPCLVMAVSLSMVLLTNVGSWPIRALPQRCSVSIKGYMGYTRTRSNKECSGDSQTCDWLPRLCLCRCCYVSEALSAIRERLFWSLFNWALQTCRPFWKLLFNMFPASPVNKHLTSHHLLSLLHVLCFSDSRTVHKGMIYLLVYNPQSLKHKSFLACVHTEFFMFALCHWHLHILGSNNFSAHIPRICPQIHQLSFFEHLVLWVMSDHVPSLVHAPHFVPSALAFFNELRF